jgi:hypothetical protein
MFDRQAAETAVRSALRKSKKPELADSPPDEDLFAALDSFAVLDFLLETETQVEEMAGRYVALGDDTIFDADKSPLRRLSSWIDYVMRTVSAA